MKGVVYTVSREEKEIPGAGYVERRNVLNRVLDEGPDSCSKPVVRQVVQKMLEYRPFRDDNGEFYCVAMDDEIKKLISFFWWEERQKLTNEIRELTRDQIHRDGMLSFARQERDEAIAIAATESRRFMDLDADIRAFRREPWYQRVWRAVRNDLP